MEGLDAYKLSTPPEVAHCDMCGERLTSYEELICGSCERKQIDANIDANIEAELAKEFANDIECMDNLKDIFFKLVDDSDWGVFEKGYAKNVFLSAQIQLSMNELRKSLSTFKRNKND